MKNAVMVAVLAVLFSAGLCILPPDGHAAVEWTLDREVALDVAPLDGALSPDGQTLFLLAPGEILVYSVNEGTVEDRIPVGREYDRVEYSPVHKALVLTSSTGKSLRMVRLEFIQRIEIDGLPVKGPKDAPVTIAVFSDYQ